ncbi:Lysophospholipase NTE1 [Fusarium oxysporum f. sp. albedinis]|nr:Lysophospholipase NTE1 [Fusarium oxysporum f. sp. albedinis]
MGKGRLAMQALTLMNTRFGLPLSRRCCTIALQLCPCGPVFPQSPKPKPKIESWSPPLRSHSERSGTVFL